ncbi:MAG: GNAT family N-acetyltransferase [Terriglobales bacterium]
MPATECQTTGSRVTVEEHHGLAGLEALTPAWQTLCEAAGTVPLVGPAWIRAHVLAFECESDLLILTARVDGQLAGVLPLIRAHAWVRGVPARILRGPGNQNTTRFDLTLLPGPQSGAVLDALWHYVAARGGWDCLLFPEVPAGGAAEDWMARAATDGFLTARWPSKQAPYIPVSAGQAGGEPGMEQTSRDFRAHLRWARRRLEDMGPLRCERQLHPQPSDLQEFFALEAAGWKGHAAHGNAVLRKGPQAERFFLELAAGAAAAGQFAVHRLQGNGRLLAMSFGLFHAQGYYLVKTAYDERYKRYSPGHLLTQALVRECAAAGRPRFDFCGEAFAYEERWTQQRLPHAFLYLFPPTARGRLLHNLKFAWPRRWLGHRPPR